MFNARKSQTKPALLLQTITDASRRRKYSPQHLSPGPDIYNIDPALSCSWNVQDFLLPPHTASLTAPLRITNLLEENYNIGFAVACSWKHCLSERSDTVHIIHITSHLLTCSKKLNAADKLETCSKKLLANCAPSSTTPPIPYTHLSSNTSTSQIYINVIQGGISAL